MRKIGRNEPCPCGSGKKYKRCHGAARVMEVDPTRFNNQLDELHRGLYRFAMQNYRGELGDMISRHPKYSPIEDEERMNLYKLGLTAWAMIHEPIKHEQTVFDIYYEDQRNKTKDARVNRAFTAWQDVTPSIYEVVSITDEKFHIRDIRINEETTVRAYEMSSVEEGDFVIGMLLPFVQKHEFLLAMFELFGADEEFIDRIKALNDEEFTKEYPAILATALTMENTPADPANEPATEASSEEMLWDNPLYGKVADIFEEHMLKKEFDEEHIAQGLEIWKTFTEKENPTFRKPESYAAALDYVLQQRVLGQANQSQKELAQIYGTSPTTISNNRKKIIEAIA